MIKKITATDFYNYIQCKYRVYLEKNGDQKLKDKVSDFVKLLWERGVQHERVVIESIIKAKNKTFVEVSKNKPSGRETFEETINLMKRGTDYIYQGVLISDNFIGRPDLLEKTNGKSKFGNYYYIPVDIKAGRGYEGDDAEDKKFKESYWLQLNFYSLLLGKIQDFIPKTGKIINIDKEEIEYDLNLNDEKFLKKLDDISAMARGKELYQPIVGGKCGLCEWQTYCKKWAEDKKDLSLLFKVGLIKYELQNYGIKIIDDILAKPLNNWLIDLPQIKKSGHFKGIAEKTLTNLYKRAKVYKSGKEEIYNPIKFLDNKTEIHFDIEDDPTQDIVYLFGFWIIDHSRKQSYYKSILAQGLNDEEKAVNDVWDFFQQLKDVPIYHYSHHEVSTLKRLQKKYKLPDEPIENFIKNSVDLYKIITDNTDWPLSSYGLKAICKFTGFKWSSEDAGGANSIEWYSKFLNGDNDMMNKILKYNEEDCRATAHLKDYLQKGC